jgi:hypothetical protein
MIGHLYTLLLAPRPAAPPPAPAPAPPGGLSWLRDRTPRFDYAAQLALAEKQRARREDEAVCLLLLA